MDNSKTNLINKVMEVLATSCERFAEEYAKQCESTLDAKCREQWIINFTAAGYPEAALDFVKRDPNVTEKDISVAEKRIQEYIEKEYHPCRCTKMECDEAVIENCHGCLNRNQDGDVTNSCMALVAKEDIQKILLTEEAEETMEQIYDSLESGNKQAPFTNEAIHALSVLYCHDLSAYNQAIEYFKGNKVAVGDIKKKVTDAVKDMKPSEKGQARIKGYGCEKASADDLCSELVPYYESLESINNYFISKGGDLCTFDKEGSPVLLCNFVPYITEKLVLNDGLSTEIFYTIGMICEGKIVLPTAIIPAKDIRRGEWMYSEFGTHAIVYTGASIDSIRCCMQLISKDAPIVEEYYSLGWIETESGWSYNFSGGSIGNESIRVSTLRELPGYRFLPLTASLEDCYAAFDKLLGITKGRPEVIFPMVAHTFSSPLLTALEKENILPKHLIWVYGSSGSFKTALSLVIMAFFGEMSNPPSTFADTVAAIEKKMYLAKDCLLLCDDFFPASSTGEASQKNSKASIITRGIGDRTAKGRASSNMSLRPEYIPRCNALVTGEDVPIGFSTTSRHISIDLNRGDVDVDILTYLQNNKHLLAGFMQYFILWVKENIMDHQNIKFKDDFLKYRSQAQNSNHHRRFAETVAQLQISFSTILKFCEDKELISREEAEVRLKKSWDTFMRIAENQNRLTQSEDIADKFMLALEEMISSGSIEPMNVALPKTTINPGTICFEDEENYYFIPSSTYSRVTEFYQKKNDPFIMSERMLWKMLDDKRYLLRQDNTDGHADYKIRKQIGIKSVRVIVIKKAVLGTF
jgi:hypothetical protein